MASPAVPTQSSTDIALGIGKATHGLHRLPTVRGSSQFPPAAHNKVTPTVFRFINGCLRITNSSTTVGTPHTWAALTPRRSFCNFTTISLLLKGTSCMGSQKRDQLNGIPHNFPAAEKENTLQQDFFIVSPWVPPEHSLPHFPPDSSAGGMCKISTCTCSSSCFSSCCCSSSCSCISPPDTPDLS